MKKKSSRNIDSTEVLVQIQEQLAVLNNKFDDFINKSLTDLAQTLAIQKAAVAARPVQATPAVSMRPLPQQNTRPKYAIVCFQCGKDSELPFKPTPGRPVYCAECFAMRRAGNVPKVNNEVKPAVEVQAPIEVKIAKSPQVKVKKKASVVKKTIAKKAVVKKTKKKSVRK